MRWRSGPTSGVRGAISLFWATSSNGAGPGAGGALRGWPSPRLGVANRWSMTRGCWGGGGGGDGGVGYRWLGGANQLINASGVLAALAALRERLPVTAQAVRNGL